MNLMAALVRKYEGDRSQAENALEFMIHALVDGDIDPESILHEEGLEPDYTMDLCWAAEKWLERNEKK